jgi:hypothetical protein
MRKPPEAFFSISSVPEGFIDITLNVLLSALSSVR